MHIPRTVKLRLSQIDVPSPTRPWCVGLRHLPQTIPTVRPAALPLLLLFQPLVVSEDSDRKTSNQQRFKLLAGRRTLQLLLEQYPRDYRTWALCVAHDASLPNTEDFEVFDTLLVKLISRPDPDDLAMIATALKNDQTLRAAADRYVDVADDAAIGRLVNMSRTTMHRRTVPTLAAGTAPPEKRVTLDFLEDAEPSPIEQPSSDRGISDE